MSGEYDTRILRLEQENDRLRAENNALRPMVSELQHKLRLIERHHATEHQPHDLPDTIHG